MSTYKQKFNPLSKSFNLVPKDIIIDPIENVYNIYDNGNSGSSKEIDWTKSSVQKIRLTNNCVLTFVPPVNAVTLRLIIYQDNPGVYKVVVPNSVQTTVGNPLNTQGITEIMSFIYDSGFYLLIGWNYDLRPIGYYG